MFKCIWQRRVRDREGGGGRGRGTNTGMERQMENQRERIESTSHLYCAVNTNHFNGWDGKKERERFMTGGSHWSVLKRKCPPCLPPSLPPCLPASLPPCLPVSLSPCLPASLLLVLLRWRVFVWTRTSSPARSLLLVLGSTGLSGTTYPRLRTLCCF